MSALRNLLSLAEEFGIALQLEGQDSTFSESELAVVYEGESDRFEVVTERVGPPMEGEEQRTLILVDTFDSATRYCESQVERGDDFQEVPVVIEDIETGARWMPKVTCTPSIEWWGTS